MNRAKLTNTIIMSRKYKFHNPEGVYFVSFAVQGWVDVLTRSEYKDILIENSLNKEARFTEPRQQRGNDFWKWWKCNKNVW